ncbi:hypothetical protein DL764_008312 [Monosporascus ibericus]|uniref:Peptidase M20 dimerisation domain-containing protein n=1 Tax=Monosporascus ibericus TaxID=155417 RepID=A0A4Q4T0L8_9PEZI|nr:hypothetical protein DL764_008312 [Monosporascus ibericus]
MVTTRSGDKSQAAARQKDPPTKTGDKRSHSKTAHSKDTDTLASDQKKTKASDNKEEHVYAGDVPDNTSESASKVPQSKLRQLIAKYGGLPLSATELAEPGKPTPDTVLALLLNAMLSSTRISHALAAKTVATVIKAGYHKLDVLKKSTWEERTEVLTEGGYTHYREKTATMMGELAELIEDKYEGDLNSILKTAGEDRTKIRAELKRIKGLGDVGIDIFFDTAQHVWPCLAPFLDPRSAKTAEAIGIGSDVQQLWDAVSREPEQMCRLAAALTKVRLDGLKSEFTELDVDMLAGLKSQFSTPRHARYISSAAGALSGLKINSDRLAETLHHTCQWGAAHSGSTETGMKRLALSEDDALVRRWFANEVRELDCNLIVDQMGNMFAKRAGSLGSPAPMTAMGSHLDTQPRGGRYDGILGVVAAIEVLRTLKENGFRTGFDVGIVNWTNEEGARFPKSMMGSGVWAGEIPAEKAWRLVDIFDPSATVISELKKYGFVGNLSCSSNAPTGHPLGAHFELHIEQGPILEESGKRIGAVQGAQAYRWLTFTVVGRDAHTGTTPLRSRNDPLLAAAKMIASSNAIAKNLGALASTGIIKIPASSSTNTIASSAGFTLDIRHPDDEVVAQVQEQCLNSFEKIAKEDGKGVEFSWALDTDSGAVKFDKDCIQVVEDAANALVGPDGWLQLTSGAGHDSVYTSKRCPTAMIFVPCKDGVSHHPEEYCSPEDW